MEKKALITGVTSQDGAYLSKYLLNKGYKVIGLIRRSQNLNFNGLKYLGIDSEIEFKLGNLLDEIWISELLRKHKFDEVYHLAAQSSVSVSFKQPISTIHFNCMSTLNLLENIRIHDLVTKFLLPVSSEMYGQNLNLPIDENSTIKPTSPYGISKAMGYWAVKNYREAYKLYASNAILFNHESFLRNENFFVKKVIKSAVLIKKGVKKYLLVGNLHVKRDFGYAPEYAKALCLILSGNAADDYIVCSGVSISLKEIVEYIFDRFNLSYKLIIPDYSLMRPAEIVDLYGDCSKIKNHLNWEYNLSFFTVIDLLIEEELRNTP